MILYAIQEWQDWLEYPTWGMGGDEEPTFFVSREKAEGYVVERAYGRHESRMLKAEKAEADRVLSQKRWDELTNAGIDPYQYGVTPPRPREQEAPSKRSWWYTPDYLNDPVAATSFSDEQIGYRVVEVETMD